MTIDEIKSIICEVMEQSDLEIHMEDNLHEDLGMCSFDAMMMIFLIEERSHKRIDISKLSENTTIEGLIKSIYLEEDN